MLVDTQILSYALKGSRSRHRSRPVELHPGQHLVPSIAAQEFLELQSSSRTQAHYYIPIVGARHGGDPFVHMASKLGLQGFSKGSTDQIILNFGADAPSHIEHSHKALTDAINRREIPLFDVATSSLSKTKRKRLKGRFRFVCDLGLEAHTLGKGSIEIGLELLTIFFDMHNPKGKIRNTINDIMILSMSKHLGIHLWTEDLLLADFARKTLGARVQSQGGLVTIDTSSRPTPRSKSQRESKGYINRGWSYKMRGARGAH